MGEDYSPGRKRWRVRNLGEVVAAGVHPALLSMREQGCGGLAMALWLGGRSACCRARFHVLAGRHSVGRMAPSGYEDPQLRGCWFALEAEDAGCGEGGDFGFGHAELFAEDGAGVFAEERGAKHFHG